MIISGNETHCVKKIYTVNILTPWSRILLEKLLIAQLVNKFTAFYCVTRAHQFRGPL